MECRRSSGEVRVKIFRWSGMCRVTGGHTGRGEGWKVGDRETVIRFGAYNIYNGRNGGLKLEMMKMLQINLDFGDIPIQQGQVRYLHVRTGRLPRPCGRHAKPAPLGSGRILLVFAPL